MIGIERPLGLLGRQREGFGKGPGDLPKCGEREASRDDGEALHELAAIGKLRARTTEEVNRRATRLIRAQPHSVRTITADNGTEFHDFAAIEQATEARFYFATPHHAWERGTNENTNGLIRQYLPKRHSMARLTQHDCYRIAAKLNRRPRKRLGYRTPEECYV